MTDRERLIELLGNLSISCEEKIGCINCKYNKEMYCKLKRKADYLLDNGVIRPPCKVGDTVYVVSGKEIFPEKVRQISLNEHGEWVVLAHFLYAFNEFGKTAFTTLEEAEKALSQLIDKQN